MISAPADFVDFHNCSRIMFPSPSLDVSIFQMLYATAKACRFAGDI
jgi:hypothetical protein